MDELITRLSDVRESCRFEGSIAEFRTSGLWLEWCEKRGRIVKVLPQDLPRDLRLRYTHFLSKLLRDYLAVHSEVRSWADYAGLPENFKTHPLLHQFGVRGEVFGVESFEEGEISTAKTKRSGSNITIEELYEMCQIQFHFQGSLGSFRRLIARKYGSFAEYCVHKGYDINATKWENDETAIRVAKKLGSIEAVKTRAPGLFIYLVDHQLVESVFGKRSA